MSTRVYYHVTLELKAPLSIGASDSDQTDNDIILDSRGNPMIPASSIAGVLRGFFYDPKAPYNSETGEDHRLDVCERIFGELGDPSYSTSAVRTYDALLVERPEQRNPNDPLKYNDTVSVRDGVKLKDDEKVAESKKKFDRQIVESGAVFQTCLEILDEDRCSTDELEGALVALHTGALRLGSKPTRGYGRMRVESCLRRRFDFPSQADEWIEFDPLNPADSAWLAADGQRVELGAELGCGPDDVVMSLALTLRGGISVREYKTDVDGVDYAQLVAHGIMRDGERVPVIPGTSWAGALRYRCSSKEVVSCFGDYAATLFGNVDEGTKEQIRSRLIIDESELSDGEWKVYTRNAIDRLTGGTIGGALYSEETYWGGHTVLTLTLHNVSMLPGGVQALKPLVVALADLHNGLLAVGGLTSVGRGLFTIDAQGSSVLVGGICNNKTTEFFQAFKGTGKDGFVIPNVEAVANVLAPTREDEGEEA